MAHPLEALCDPETFERFLREDALQFLRELGTVGEASTDIAHCFPYPLKSDQLLGLHVPHWGFLSNDGQTLVLTEAHNYLLAERNGDGTIHRVADVEYHTFPKLLVDESAAALLTQKRLASVLLHAADHLDDAGFLSLVGYAPVEQDGYRTVAYYGPWYSDHPFAGQALDALMDDGEAYRVVPLRDGAEVGVVDPAYKGPVLITRVQPEVIQPEDPLEALLGGFFSDGQGSSVEIVIIGPSGMYSLGGSGEGDLRVRSGSLNDLFHELGDEDGLLGDSPNQVIDLPRRDYGQVVDDLLKGPLHSDAEKKGAFSRALHAILNLFK